MESDAFLDFLLTADPFNLGLPLSLGLQDEGGPCEGERSQQGVSEGSQVGHSIVFDLSRECDLVSSLDVNELDIDLPLFSDEIEVAPQESPSAIGPQHTPEECQASYLPVPNVKTGSQAFSYIPEDALFETNGIPAPPRLALMAPEYNGTPPLKDLSLEPKLVTGGASGDVLCGTVGDKVPFTLLGTVPAAQKLVPCENSALFPSGTEIIGQKLVPNEITDSFPHGTVSVEPKIVPDAANGSPILYGTQVLDPKVPDQARSASVPVPKLNTAVMNYGTQNVDTMATVPDRTTTTSVPCGIQTSNPKIGQESAGMCHSAAYGTVTINTSLIQAPESASGAAHTTQTHTTNTTKKRIRKRKKPEEMVKKTRKYEQGPLSDHLEERKRLDAIRAKRCRERNRNDVMALKEKLALVEEEKGAMAKEIAQREAYEGVLRKLLWEKTGIAVLPYASPSPSPSPSSSSSSSSNKMALPQLQTTG